MSPDPRRPGDMYTGRMLEADFLGEVNTNDPRYLARARELGITEEGYLPDREAMILAKEFQPWQDVTVPEKDLPRDLRLEVFELLLEKGLVKRGQEDRVKIYTSVGTPFDYKHGIDTFLELEDEKGNIIARVTLDITQREEKIKTGGKADIIFSELPDPKNENERYLRAIDDLAKDAVELLAHRRKAALRQMPETQPEARA